MEKVRDKGADVAKKTEQEKQDMLKELQKKKE